MHRLDVNFAVIISFGFTMLVVENAHAEDAPPLDEARLMDAMVEYRTAWRRGYGFLVGDNRTVLAPGLYGGSDPFGQGHGAVGLGSR